MIQSESTRVPPVTAERSPPDFADDRRRLAGDRRLVDADATPSMISPSPGMNWPASTARRRRRAGALARHRLASGRPSQRGSAIVSVRVLRSVAACALPRPSAIASAKLANSTVNQSQNATWPVKSGVPVAAGQLLHPDDRREEAADLDDEHHRVLDLDPRIELPERVDDRLPDDAGIPDRDLRARSAMVVS